MNTDAFTVWMDKTGDLYVQDGVVMQPRTGVVIVAGAGEGLSTTSDNRTGEQLVPAPMAIGCTFVGGSGRNIFSAGLAPRSSGADVPAGWWRPTVTDNWQLGIFTLIVTGPSDAFITDGDAIVAILSSGGTAPIGTYASTVYGQASYGEIVATVPQPFVLTVTGEEGGILGALPSCRAEISGGTATDAAQHYIPTDAANYAGSTDPDWTIEIAPDGSAELRYLTDVIAEREAGGLTYDPAGSYAATVLGKATYNLTDDEPVDGEDWNVTVEVNQRAPRAGTIYLQLVETGGILTAVNGPFLKTILPANTATEFHYPLASCDGYTVEQYHTGMLKWERGSAVDIGTPASAAAPGVAGQMMADDTYLYICTATDTWKRRSHATW